VNIDSNVAMTAATWGVFRQDRPATTGYLVHVTRDRSVAETLARDVIREGHGAVNARVVQLGTAVPATSYQVPAVVTASGYQTPASLGAGHYWVKPSAA
jgi:hypothetical protein